MWLFTYNHTCFGYIQISTLNNKNTFGASYKNDVNVYKQETSSLIYATKLEKLM